jgi:hypothetical protein
MKSIFTKTYLIIIWFHIIIISLYPQQSRLYKSVRAISSYVASEHFKELKLTNPDLALVDSIYIYALKQNNYNRSETLFSLTFGIIPFKIVPVKTPLLSLKIKLPLTAVEDSLFYKKIKQLPKNLLIDSPQNDFGDKDKLAHFFGNAFIRYNSLFFDFTKLFGYFVEVFEETFEVDNKIDFRDLKANELGDAFAELLKDNPNALPSQVFLLYNLKFFRFTL